MVDQLIAWLPNRHGLAQGNPMEAPGATCPLPPSWPPTERRAQRLRQDTAIPACPYMQELSGSLLISALGWDVPLKKVEANQNCIRYFGDRHEKALLPGLQFVLAAQPLLFGRYDLIAVGGRVITFAPEAAIDRLA